MNIPLQRWFALGMFAGAVLAGPAAAALPVVSHVSDPAGLLATERLGMIDLEAKLADYETSTGIRILVQFHTKSPSAAEDEVPGAYMRALSAKLGVIQHGVLVVYFADDPDWRVWIGDDLTSTFTGQPGTVQELTVSKAIHDAKEAMLASAHAKAEASFAELQKASLANQPPTPAQHLEMHTDALLDALIAKLAPTGQR